MLSPSDLTSATRLTGSSILTVPSSGLGGSGSPAAVSSIGTASSGFAGSSSNLEGSSDSEIPTVSSPVEGSSIFTGATSGGCDSAFGLGSTSLGGTSSTLGVVSSLTTGLSELTGSASAPSVSGADSLGAAVSSTLINGEDSTVPSTAALTCESCNKSPISISRGEASGVLSKTGLVSAISNKLSRS